MGFTAQGSAGKVRCFSARARPQKLAVGVRREFEGFSVGLGKILGIVRFLSMKDEH